MAADATADGRAENIVILDLAGLTTVSDYFVICSGQNPVQTRALADHVGRALREVHRRPSHIEGYKEGLWILLDYGDVVVHIFHAEERDYYGLERLWGDATQLAYSGAPSDHP